MRLIRAIFERNSLLAYVGLSLFLLSVGLALYAPFNEVELLGINTMIKPIKFGLSTGIYAWTMAYLLYYVKNQRHVRRYSILATATMLYENAVITGQALRGELSHFNSAEAVGSILYALMGIMILWLTLATLVLAIRFIRQKEYAIPPAFVLSIKIGLILFVVFSLFGGLMSAINSHNFGGPIGGPGLPLLNWSTEIGDLRVAHFFGMHTLQLIPIVGYLLSKRPGLATTKAKRGVWIFSLIYFLFVCFTAYQAFQGQPFLSF